MALSWPSPCPIAGAGNRRGPGSGSWILLLRERRTKSRGTHTCTTHSAHNQTCTSPHARTHNYMHRTQASLGALGPKCGGTAARAPSPARRGAEPNSAQPVFLHCFARAVVAAQVARGIQLSTANWPLLPPCLGPLRDPQPSPESWPKTLTFPPRDEHSRAPAAAAAPGPRCARAPEWATCSAG